MAILKTENLTYVYQNGTEALKGISLEIERGEKIAFVGANGSGKSTFFLNLNGVYTPSAGKIFFDGNLIDKKRLNELRKKVGIVFQDPDSQIIAPTVKQEVSFGPMNLKLPLVQVQKRISASLEKMNLSGFEDRPPHYLSGGEKKKVTIADILAMEPEVFIFDEPTSALDPANSDSLDNVLESLSSEGKTILVSTHNLDFAFRWAERIIVFCDGFIIADGAPDNIFRKESILEKANLKKPTMLCVYEILAEKGLISSDTHVPKTVDELRSFMTNKKEVY